jgi:hypothetical protein
MPQHWLKKNSKWVVCDKNCDVCKCNLESWYAPQAPRKVLKHMLNISIVNKNTKNEKFVPEYSCIGFKELLEPNEVSTTDIKKIITGVEKMNTDDVEKIITGVKKMDINPNSKKIKCINVDCKLKTTSKTGFCKTHRS